MNTYTPVREMTQQAAQKAADAYATARQALSVAESLKARVDVLERDLAAAEGEIERLRAERARVPAEPARLRKKAA